jgi:thioesterase domain-containing protein/acyl carrier protein
LLRDIFTPLSLGASLFIPELFNQAPGELKAWLRENEISIVHLTPAMLGLIGPSPAVSNGQNTFLRYAFFGGDLLTDQHLASLSLFAPKATAVNFYGTTETPQAMGFFIVPKPEIADTVESKTEFRRVPLGQGIDDVQLLILNGSEQLAGLGELGELYVRTPYLSDGYLDEELTRERFVINPLTGQAHDLLFRTGDLARYLPDGNVEFVGRADKQVKIRGFRIELGEVESALRQHPDLRDAVVICRSNRSEETSAGSATDKILAAFLVPNRDTPPGPDMLHSFLTDRLPAYMIPSAYVPIEKIPLTSNGKVDFGSLPEPDSPSPRHSAYAKPHGAAQRRLAQIWGDLLHVDRIGRIDNFFELGGHSLLAVQLFEQIEASFGRKLPLATLFQVPTIDQLARLVSQNTEVTISTKSLVAIQPAGSRPPFFCVHGIGGHVLRYYDLPLYLGENQPFYGLQSQGLDGHQEACQTIEEMAVHYIEEIRTVQNEGPYLVGGLSLGSYVAYEMACQLERQGDHVGLVALFDGHASNLPGYREALSRIGRIRHLERSLAEKIKYHAKNLSRLSPSQQAQYVQGVITRKVPNGGRDHHQADNDSVPDHLQKIYWTNGLAMSQYIPGPYPGKITLFRANASRGTYRGWDDFAFGGVDIYDIPGNHTSIVDEPNVKTLAQQLEMCIDNVLHDQAASDKNSNPSNLAVKQAYEQI